MDVNIENEAQTLLSHSPVVTTSDSSHPQSFPSHELAGGPFAVIESDPGAFTQLTRALGVRGLEVVELYDIEPWAVDQLNPHGLIFCFLWHKDSHRPADFEDPDGGRVWFANQLINDACASQAILNIVLNCPDVEIGEYLRVFKAETDEMSAVMKGLAISNSRMIRDAHNSLARPADRRGALRAAAKSAMDESKAIKARYLKPATLKRSKAGDATIASKSTRKSISDADEQEETYHFIGYVPTYGKVWELDGLKSGPIEVGEIPATANPTPEPLSDPYPSKGWMDIVRPALRMKMQRYGGAAEGGNIRFSLLALVNCRYQTASDELEILKRKKNALERRLNEEFPDGWHDNVDQGLLDSATEALMTSVQASEYGPTFATDFGSRKLQQDVAVLDLPRRNLVVAWEACIQAALSAKISVEDEVLKSQRAHTDHVRRTHDYEPFLKEFVASLHNEGLLHALLDLDNTGKRKKMKVKGRR